MLCRTGLQHTGKRCRCTVYIYVCGVLCLLQVRISLVHDVPVRRELTSIPISTFVDKYTGPKAARTIAKLDDEEQNFFYMRECACEQLWMLLCALCRVPAFVCLCAASALLLVAAC